MRYLHTVAGFPTEETWYSAVQAGNYNSWPWLNPKNVRAHFPESEETQKGHMQNTRQGLRSTKKRVQPVEEADSSPRDTKKEDVFTCVFDLQDEMQSTIYDKTEEKIYTDQTGKFPVGSNRGHQYVMVLINMDSSYVSMEPMKNQHSSEIVMTYQILPNRLKACGINPKPHVLNSECSEDFR